MLEKRESVHRGEVVLTVRLALFASLFLTAFSMSSMISNADDRLFLTTTDTFHRFYALRDLFARARNYSLLLNPPTFAHVAFDPSMDSLDELDDWFNRRLITGSDRDKAVQLWPALQTYQDALANQSLLYALMRTSWCSYPNALRNTTPVTRSPGCGCIGDAYRGFVMETMGNSSNPFRFVNTSVSVREKYGDEVLRCFDKRQVSRTYSCGLVCSAHPGGLVLYVNIVLVLGLTAYVLFSEVRTLFDGCSSSLTEMLLLKFFIVGLAAALGTPFFVYDIQANVLMLSGLAVCVVYLTVTLHAELDSLGVEDKRRRPHPLSVLLLVHLQLILPALGAIVSISGYGRDIWALLSFVIVTWLMGLIMQRFFWTYWNSASEDSLVDQGVLIVCFIALWILFILLFVAYYFEESLFLSGSVWFFSVLALYLFLMMGFLVGDRVHVAYMDPLTPGVYFGVYQQGMLLATLAVTIFTTVIVLVDAARY